MTRRKHKKLTKENAELKVLQPVGGKGRYKNAMYTTLFALIGIYGTFFSLIFIADSNAVSDLFHTQALLGGLYVNLFAVVSVAYSKFAKEIFVHRKIYWLSLIAFIVIVCIFAQARGMVDSSTTFVCDWLESTAVSWGLQLMLAVLIFAIASQEELNMRVTYKKKYLK